MTFDATTAPAHPLGNFSVNRYHGLRPHPDRLRDLAGLDEAEIPTRQNMSTVDTDANTITTDAERTAFAAVECRDYAAGLKTKWTQGRRPGSSPRATSPSTPVRRTFRPAGRNAG